MAEMIWEAFKGLDDFIKVFLLSMFPVTELRVTLPMAMALGMPFYKAFIAAYLGNILPVPFILLLLEPLSSRLPFFANFVSRVSVRSGRQREKIEKYGLWGLLFFVAVPLPVTGVWTGSLFASVLRLPFWPSLAVIWTGAFLAAVVVSLAAHGVLTLAGYSSWFTVIVILFILIYLVLRKKR